MMMSSPKKSFKRRSLYGTRQSLTDSRRKSTRLSIPGPELISYRCKSNEDSENRQLSPELLINITERTWTLYRVTGLNKLQNTSVKLKQYATYIRNDLVKSVKDVSRDVTFKVELSEIKEFEKDSNSLQIEVFYKNEENKQTLKYKGIILSWSNNNLTDFSDSSLLFCAGAINIIKIIHKSLTYLFDTKILPLKVSENDLMWLSAMLSDVDSKNSVTFELSLIGSIVHNSVPFSIPSITIKKLWNHIHPQESEEITFEEVHNFHKKLQDQLQATFGLNFKYLKLNKIIMCDATISSDGKIKIFNENVIEKIFSFLKDLSLLIDIPYTKMGLDVEMSDESS